jgi:hypothetical protein
LRPLALVLIHLADPTRHRKLSQSISYHSAKLAYTLTKSNCLNDTEGS